MRGAISTKLLLMPAFMLPLSGCLLHGQDKLPTSSAARINYFVPASAVTLTADMQIRSCESPVVVIAGISLAAKPGAGEPMAFDPQPLMSALKSRDFKIELSDKRLLKSVNATNTDETGTVISNLVKLVGSFAGLAITAQSRNIDSNDKNKVVTVNPCNAATNGYIEEVKRLEKRIGELRWALVSTTSAKEAAEIDTQISKHAGRIADIRTGPLTVTMTRPLSVGQPLEKEDTTTKLALVKPRIYWTIGELAKWFSQDPVTDPCTLEANAKAYLFPTSAAVTCSTKVEQFAIEQLMSPFPVLDQTPGESATNLQIEDVFKAAKCQLSQDRADEFKCRDKYVVAKEISPGEYGTLEPSVYDAKYRELCLKTAPDKRCTEMLAFRDTVTITVGARFLASEATSIAIKDPSTPFAKISLVVPQYGTQRLLTFNPGFAERVTTSMTFDDYGRPVTLGWNSTARAVAATQALTSTLDNMTAVVKAIQGDEVADQKAEIDRLNTQLSLNNLRWCQAVIEAGGNCDPTKMPPPP